MESNTGNQKHSQRGIKKSHQVQKNAANELSRVNPLTGQRIANTESQIFQRCERLVTEMTKHPSAQYFMNLASATINTETIKEPIDLTILGKRLSQGYYLDVKQFVADARKIWENSWSINKTGTDLYIATTNMSNYFENLVKDVTMPAPKANPKTQKSHHPKANLTNRADAGKDNEPMTIQEKSLLRQNIMRIGPDKIQGLVDIIQSVVDTKKSKESLEFDIDKLPNRVCRELERYVNRCIGEKPTRESVQLGTRQQPVVRIKKTYSNRRKRWQKKQKLILYQNLEKE